jgi:hypothetical protein
MYYAHLQWPLLHAILLVGIWMYKYIFVLFLTTLLFHIFHKI